MKRCAILLPLVIGLLQPLHGDELDAYDHSEPVNLAVRSLKAGPGVEPGVPGTITHYLLSGFSRLPGVRVFDPGTGTPEQNGVYLEGTVYRAGEGYLLTLFLYSESRASVLIAESVEIDSRGFTIQIANTVDSVGRELGTENRLDIAAVLLQEGNYELAWEYYLRALTADSGSLELEYEIRRGLSEELAARSVRGDVSPGEAVQLFLRAALIDPGQSPSDRTVALRDAGELLPDNLHDAIDDEMHDIEHELERAIRRRSIATAKDILRRDNFERLQEIQPVWAHDMRRDVEELEWDISIRSAAALRRRGEFDQAYDSLDKALQLRPDHTETREAIAAIDAAVQQNDKQLQRAADRPESTEARIQSELVLHAAVSSSGTQDIQRRFLIDSRSTRFTVGAELLSPLLPYVRSRFGIQAGYVNYTPAANDFEDYRYSWKSLQPEAHIGAAISSELLELSVSGFGGLYAMAGQRDYETGSGPQSDFYAGPSVGMQVETSVYIPHLPLRLGIFLKSGRALWFPERYLTPVSTVGLRLGWVNGATSIPEWLPLR